MNVKRRYFLQLAGSTLATVGLSQLSVQQQAESYGKVLAINAPRKLALLVGIDDYPSEYGLNPLAGCVKDVELQRHLLKYRFGFKDSDIYILTNKEATRQGILEAFEKHLIKQANPGDVVVFHYSGHGSRIVDPDPIFVSSTQDKTGLNGTLVPVDARLPVGYPELSGTVQDIMGHTLFLLMSALKTENVTVVLDSCFSGAAARDNVVLRTRSGGKNILISPDEKKYQEQWLSKLNLNRQKFIEGYRAGIAKGIVLTATSPEQLASEAKFGVGLDGFSTGAFTYYLTQYLWQQTSSVENAIPEVEEKISKPYGQTPGYEAKVGSEYGKQPIYFTNPQITASSDAVITKIKDLVVTLWLGGIDPVTVNKGTVFAVVTEGNSSLKVTVQKRQGFVATAIASGVVKEGTLLRKTG
jgi:hypothetical protein